MAGILGWLTAALVSVAALILWLPRELWRRWRVRLVDSIDLALGRRVSRFRRRYRDRLLHELRFIDLKGLGTVGSHHPKLDDVYVDVSLDQRAPHEVSSGVLSDLPGDISGRYWLGDLLDQKEPRMLAALGAPGSGKTTLLRYTARQVLQSNHRKRSVPILLYLRDHITKIVNDPTMPLSAAIQHQLKTLGLSEPTGWFEQHLNNGDCVVLLDGLDEVARQDERRIVADWVEQQLAQYPKNDFVITSRPHGYRATPINGATVLQVRGFTTRQAVRFVHNWYRVVERSSAEEESQADSDLRAASAADDLLERLNNATQLLDLTVNPLLLTMVANVHRYRGALPGSRVELYGEICQVMLWRRHEAKRLPIELNGEQKERTLRALALVMMRQKLRDMPGDDVLGELRTALRRISTKLSADGLLADVMSSGLIIEREAGQYSFAHLTFQEYLAATHIRDTGAVDLLTESVDDVWWRETAILYSARSTGDPVVAACLSSGSIVALALAFDIAEEGDLAPDLRSSLEKILNSITDDPEAQQLRNGVLLTRYLRRRLIRTSTGERVYGLPISRGIYQLFTNNERHVPAIDTESSEPAMGAWASDAEAFTQWVNFTTNSEPGYRLVAVKELEDPALREVLADSLKRPVWTRSSESTTPQLWIPQQSEHPHLIDGDTLVRYVRQDIKHLAVTLIYLALHLADGPWKGLKRYRRHHDRAISFAQSTAIAVGQREYSIENEDWRRVINRDTWEEYPFSDLLADVDLENVVRRVQYRGDLNEAILEFMFGLYAVGVISQRRSFRGTLDTNFAGLALLPYLRRELEADLHRERGLDWFIGRFVDDSDAAAFNRIVPLTDLAEVISETNLQFRGLTHPAPSAEVRLSADILVDTALPIFARRDEMPRASASKIRIAALALAIEAQRLGAAEIGSRYREIAAATTLLQRRANGESPSEEMIMLAII